MEEDNYDEMTPIEFREYTEKMAVETDGELSEHFSSLNYAWRIVCCCPQDLFDEYMDEIIKLKGHTVMALRNGFATEKMAEFAEDLAYRLTPAITYGLPREVADKVYKLSYHLYAKAFLKTCGDATEKELRENTEAIHEEMSTIDPNSLNIFLTRKINHDHKAVLTAKDEESAKMAQAEENVTRMAMKNARSARRSLTGSRRKS